MSAWLSAVIVGTLIGNALGWGIRACYRWATRRYDQRQLKRAFLRAASDRRPRIVIDPANTCAGPDCCCQPNFGQPNG